MHTAHHMATGCALGNAFDVDEADGEPVPEPLAKGLRIFLRMVPDD